MKARVYIIGALVVLMLLLTAAPASAATLAQRVKRLEANVAKLTKTVNTLNASIGTLNSQLAAQSATIDTLQSKVASHSTSLGTLTNQFGSLQTTVASHSTSIGALDSSFTTLNGKVTTIQTNPALALGPYVSVQTGTRRNLQGPHIFFTGANVHIVSGSDQTNDTTGLGNLILGYNETWPGMVDGDRHGSHNLVVGRYHKYWGWGGFVAGERNTIGGSAAVVSGGVDNGARGGCSSVGGGYQNTIEETGNYSTISGGHNIRVTAEGYWVGGSYLTAP